MGTTVDVTVNGVEYEAVLDGKTVRIYDAEERALVGTGTLRDGYLECTADLGDDVYDALADALRDAAPVAEVCDGTWTVRAGSSRWWPSDEAEAEIDAADDPAAAALRICVDTPMRGERRD